jgi:hypothetical protein
LRPRKTGRIARLIEFDSAYCDTIVERFERVICNRPFFLGLNSPLKMLLANDQWMATLGERRQGPNSAGATADCQTLAAEIKEQVITGTGYRRPAVDRPSTGSLRKAHQAILPVVRKS